MWVGEGKVGREGGGVEGFGRYDSSFLFFLSTFSLKNEDHLLTAVSLAPCVECFIYIVDVKYVR